MFKTIKAVLNNLNEEPFFKNKNSLKLYDMSAKNQVPLDKNCSEMEDITDFEINYRRNNLKVYAKNIAKIRGVQTVIVGIPALLCAATIYSFSLGSTTKTKSFDTYKKNVIEYDEENIYQDGIEDKIYADIYFCSKSFIDEKVEGNLSAFNSKANIYFGNGKNAIKVTYLIDSDGKWRVSNYSEGCYIDLEKRDVENAEDTNEKYDKLIEEATNVYINYLEERFGDSTVKEYTDILDEVIHNEKNDISFRIEQFVDNGKMDLEYNKSNILWRIIMIIADIIYGAILFWFFYENKIDDIEFMDLSSDKGYLQEKSRLLCIKDFLYAPLNYREEFLQAEKERILAIDKILKDHNGDNKILSKYEKKLIKKEKE